MTVTYNIAGRQIGSHYLAIAVLGTVGGLVAMSTGGSSAAKKEAGPPINAKSPDEEKFIKDFMASMEGDAKKGNNVDMTKGDAGR
ncbi:ATP synthase subunit K mitochondrial protein [Rutstroemia sp. NJR-2017a BVV2]|nr:ATP synthase subunit K mitochondrial protein [Rutstroemia sp. NJR-2017a BVV2]PQE26146.1 ATP synthase subunit K mitochondrial protein [Rutstroemia sp. NJR-2017a BBW]PQE32084.1 ATP synthase subunit mitochondrial protein [Rutstroemia sp. NJR-2017a WRK4]